MSASMQFLPAGEGALLVELPDLAQTLALFQALQRQPLAGVDEAIPAARTLLLHYRPAAITAAQLAGRLRQLQRAGVAGPGAQGQAASGRLVEIPVRYEGEDLEEVAALLGLTAAEVIERHTGSAYQAAFAGFAPGFVYLTGADPGFEVPRRQSPRTRVPAGSVALAGDFSAVYPSDSPGGWQLIGVTPCRMWDLQRAEPAFVQPGFRVRFRDLAKAGVQISLPGAAPALPAAAPAAPADGPDQLEFLSTGLQTLVQDLGRLGKTALGVSASGALDRQAMREANRAVGNPSDAPVLENLLGNLRLRCRGQAVVAAAGADVPLQLRTAAGRVLQMPGGEPLALEEGDTLTLGPPRAGLRSYLAVRGGWHVQPVLDSCATDTLARLGPEPLRAGDVLACGAAIPAHRLQAVRPDAGAPRPLPKAGGVVELEVSFGPRTPWFTPEAVALLLSQEWEVTPQSSRVGIRLSGAQALTRSIHSELPSEGTVLGAIQVPASGQPVLFLADHPLTGGYPVIAVVASHHLDLAAQIPPGARLRFRAAASFAPIAPAAA